MRDQCYSKKKATTETPIEFRTIIIIDNDDEADDF